MKDKSLLLRRPLSDKEINDKERDVLANIDEFTIEQPWNDDRSKQFVYDRVFDDDAIQEDVFEDTMYLVPSVVDGYNKYSLLKILNNSAVAHGMSPRLFSVP
ncbi:hypothetical protein K1719_014976 [Acacia pycnantha]|nr:hypothetical protein K1719_014976 [Acacia pycnantha]